MIPKVIHYCWFGKKSMPEKDRKCIESWKKYCPDHEVVEWNEENYDIHKNEYMEQAFHAGKWGFVSDYARIDIIYQYGGIYFDTDVELIRSFDVFLDNQMFCGFENAQYVAFGLGFGAEKGNHYLKELLDEYEKIRFLNADGTYNLTTCPVIQTEVLKRHGLVLNNEKQYLDECTVYPSDFFCPKSYRTGKIDITLNTYSIHHYNMSWRDENSKKLQLVNQKLTSRYGARIAKYLLIPFRFYFKMKSVGLKECILYAVRKVLK